MLYLRLFWEFFKTGLFSIGGGMATIPFLYNICDTTGWFTRDDLANMVAISESTPGPIGVNMATYVGFVTGMAEGNVLTAILGAVTATVGLITPCIIVILIIAAILRGFRDSPYVNRAFYGLRPASAGLIAAAGLNVMISNLFTVGGSFGLNGKALLLAAALWLLTNKVRKTKGLHPIVFIALSAVAGVVFAM